MSSNANFERRQRIREQMKEFYGDPNANAKKAVDKPRRADGVSPEMDLDSEYFNVSRYTTDLLRRESLKGLVEADTELLRSVRRLDGELQELVYRNYAKFISATDTIREMRDNVVEMDTKLQALSGNMTSIDSVSKTISEKLQVHRSHIEETISANRMLKKVQFLVGLPATMRQLLDRREYNVCVKYWVAGDSFLTKHASLSSIASIQKECRQLAQQLYQSMEEGMCAIPLDDPEAMDTIRKFVEDLRLMRATSLFAADRPSAENVTFEESVMRTLMSSVAANFSTGVAAVQRGIRVALAIPELNQIALNQRDGPLAQATLREALAQLKSACALLSVNSERVYSLMNHLDAARIAMRVAQEVQPVLIDLLSPLSSLLADLAVTSFCSIADAGEVALMSPVMVGDVLQAAVTALMRQLKHIGFTMKTIGANYLDTPLGQQSKSYAGLVDQAILDVLRTCLARCRQKVVQAPSAAALQAVVATNKTTATLLSGAVMPEAQRAHQLHLSFCMSRFVYASLATLLHDGIALNLVGGDVIAAESATKESAALADVAKDLQHRGVILLGQLELRAVQESAFTGPCSTDPTEPGGGVSPGLQELLAEWTKLDQALQGIPPLQPVSSTSSASSRPVASRYDPLAMTSTFSGGGSSSGGRIAGYGSSSGRVSGHGARGPARLVTNFTRHDHAALQSNVDRIFSNASAMLHTTPLDGRPGVTMGCTVLYLLKALVEGVRAVRAFDTYGFQRVQINSTFLLRALCSPARGTAPRKWRKAWDSDMIRAVQQQLDEICVGAYERYEAKVPLANITLDKIVEASLGGTTTDDAQTSTYADRYEPNALPPLPSSAHVADDNDVLPSNAKEMMDLSAASPPANTQPTTAAAAATTTMPSAPRATPPADASFSRKPAQSGHFASMDDDEDLPLQ